MTHESLGALALRSIADQANDIETASAPRGLKIARRADGPAEHLGDLAIIVRNEFRLADVMPDATILRALSAVLAETTPRGRWLALFNSDLGRAIANQKRDLNTAFGFVLAQLPQRPS